MGKDVSLERQFLQFSLPLCQNFNYKIVRFNKLPIIYIFSLNSYSLSFLFADFFLEKLHMTEQCCSSRDTLLKSFQYICS